MKRLIGIVMIFLFVFINTNKGNVIPIDSLRATIRNLPDDTAKVLELADLSKKYLKYQIDTSFIIAKNAIQLSKDLNYIFGYAYALKQMGLVYKYMSEYDSALYYYDKSINLFDSLEIDSERASVLNRIANVYKRKGDFDKSLESFFLSLNISRRINDSILISAIYNNLSVLYRNMFEYDKALEYQLMNLDILRKLRLDDNVPIVLMNIGNVYKQKQDFNQAINYYKQSLELTDSNGNIYDKLLLLHNIGVVYELTERYNASEQYYIKAIKIEKEIGNKDMLVYSLQGIGNVLVKTDRYPDGIKYLLESYKLASEIGSLLQKRILSENLYKVYKANKDYKNSLEYLKIYKEIQDSIFNEEYIKQVTSLEQKYEAEKREQQIAFLEKEQAIQKLKLSKKEIEAKQKSFQRNVLIIAIILLLTFMVYFGVENKKRKRFNSLLIKQNKKIIEQRTEIAKQNDELIESNKTKDNLFQIIAHDLRSPLVSMDSIAQLIPYWVEEQDYKSLKKLSKTIELSVNNVLSLIDNLLNWALNQQGKFPYKPENLKLKENILETIEVYRPIAEIKNIDLKFTFSKNVMVFADRNMLFTVMRNLLNNAVKFTPEKGEIVVGIDSNQQFAKVWVRDSGIGIPKAKREMAFELA
ncbi:MAG: tetratricopeptide repeat-containing sensor histidine kinase, partial [Bacteroidales bacterium]|nr:tetratricopeptide repeat-containing sensor histidine kinase [Bacteroidales bacterium]